MGKKISLKGATKVNLIKEIMTEEHMIIKKADLKSLQLAYHESVEARKMLESLIEKLRKEIEELKK
jgi:hypothetical protein